VNPSLAPHGAGFDQQTHQENQAIKTAFRVSAALADLVPGPVTKMTFTADIPGVFEAEFDGHGIGGRIDLPLPVWQLAWAAGFAVAISFVALGAFWQSLNPFWTIPLVIITEIIGRVAHRLHDRDARRDDHPHGARSADTPRRLSPMWPADARGSTGPREDAYIPSRDG